jgi:hypothetical protein
MNSLLLRSKLCNECRNVCSAGSGYLLKGAKLVHEHRFEVMLHFTNSHSLSLTLVLSLRVAFEDLFGRFRAASVVEEG